MIKNPKPIDSDTIQYAWFKCTNLNQLYIFQWSPANKYWVILNSTNIDESNFEFIEMIEKPSIYDKNTKVVINFINELKNAGLEPHNIKYFHLFKLYSLYRVLLSKNDNREVYAEVRVILDKLEQTEYTSYANALLIA